ncbi:hypothetical protein P3T24_000772 [Paraburkholderia sp. GAS33]|jgi:hypothetical protein
MRGTFDIVSNLRTHTQAAAAKARSQAFRVNPSRITQFLDARRDQSTDNVYVDSRPLRAKASYNLLRIG